MTVWGGGLDAARVAGALLGAGPCHYGEIMALCGGEFRLVVLPLDPEIDR